MKRLALPVLSGLQNSEWQACGRCEWEEHCAVNTVESHECVIGAKRKRERGCGQFDDEDRDQTDSTMTSVSRCTA